MTNNLLTIKNKVEEVLMKNEVYDNFYQPELGTSLKFNKLLQLSKKTKKSLVIEGFGALSFVEDGKRKVECISSRVIADLSLSKATQDLSDDIFDQFFDRYEDIQPEADPRFIEGLELIQITNDEIVCYLLSGS